MCRSAEYGDNLFGVLDYGLFCVIKNQVRRNVLRNLVESCCFKHAVAPRAGAWIETSYLPAKPNNPPSPPVRGRGLKLMFNIVGRRIGPRRPPCGGVD